MILARSVSRGVGEGKRGGGEEGRREEGKRGRGEEGKRGRGRDGRDSTRFKLYKWSVIGFRALATDFGQTYLLLEESCTSVELSNAFLIRIMRYSSLFVRACNPLFCSPCMLLAVTTCAATIAYSEDTSVRATEASKNNGLSGVTSYLRAFINPNEQVHALAHECTRIRTYTHYLITNVPLLAGLINAVGNTPLIYLRYLKSDQFLLVIKWFHTFSYPPFPRRSVSEATGCKIYGKAEFMNPTASVKVL